MTDVFGSARGPHRHWRLPPRVATLPVALALCLSLLPGVSIPGSDLGAGIAEAATTASTATAISAGGGHTCARMSDGTVTCWGANWSGQLGDGTMTDRPTPVTVSGITTATAISAGSEHTCALLSGGSVKCWGANYDGQLGNGTTEWSETPVTVSGITTATAISAGSANYTCAILAAGSVKCWGANDNGQLGDGTTTGRLTPVTVSGITTATAISAGSLHTCALLSGGSVKCWGANDDGQLGDGTTTSRLTPVIVSGVTTATAISAGGRHTCARLSGGAVKCWGANGSGQLGNGTSDYEPHPTPVTVSGITTATAISAGFFDYTCAILAGGSARCWGANDDGQLGDGTTTSRLTPVTVSGITTATAISAGGRHTCARLSSGAVECWGANRSGQLGDGTTGYTTTPVAVSGITTASAISAGVGHTCAILSGGTVRCWGYNGSGELGDGTTTDRPTPVTVSGITTAIAIATDDLYTCALLSGGSVRCWGTNWSGQLGNGTTDWSPTPVTVSGMTTATAITAGFAHTCAILSGGAVKCWGYNGSGQLGDGTTTDRLTPVTVSGITTATAISAGSEHTCAILSGGAVKCWGANRSGQLGNGTSDENPHPTPVTVSGTATATAISAGSEHTCAILSGGAVKCWGANRSGQLGNGTSDFEPHPTPVTVSGITTATAISAGSEHTCAILSGGAARCWGNNSVGQLGNGTSAEQPHPTPVAVSGITTATTISAGSGHTCAILTGGAARCWGWKGSGQLGDGTTNYSTTPVAVVFPKTPFADISSSQFKADIEWLYESGITTGCTVNLFCPEDSVTRGQMAAFLDRALSLPPTTKDFFTDDESSMFEASINRLAAARITTGCTATTFCPSATVRRDQMASFLARAFALPATATDFFTDDAGSIHEVNINRLAASGITTGCTATTYCPSDEVTRGQMAAFLHRALVKYPQAAAAAAPRP